ncbi:MAG: rhomboid family intramembrane serine protease [Alphaproteobacteria bacterium]|nr:MAG: rhomboid family intramembrane serine protease [Alphaproteobacteria bacterium]
MIPLHDDNPTTLTPVVTIGLIGTCVLVFLWQLSLGPVGAQKAVYSFGMIPAVLFGEAHLPPEVARIPPEVSILTSMFLHGGWMHLIGNMLYLWIFGNNVEDSMGHVRFIVFYLLGGTAAALTQALQDPTSTVPMIGASGAIGAVLGGYIMLFPRAHVLVLVPIGFFLTTVRVPALVVLGFWFVLQFIQSALSTGQPGGVAYWAHIGGFITGAILIIPFRSRRFPLFGGPRGHRHSGAGRRPRRRGGSTGPWG